MNIWTIYNKPYDFPNLYVARLYDNEKPTQQFVTAETLDQVRKLIPLTPIPRDPEDPPMVVESWI